jgi:peptidoglycan-associated lipoprotein
MSYAVKAVLIVAALGLSACAKKPGFNDGAMNGANSAVQYGALGDPSDPRSIAYFNQTVGDRVLFAVDQSTISDEGRGILSAQAQWLTANPDYAVIIEGHADEQGTREYNLALGARRAAAAQNYLISQGVPASRMRTISYGKERPIEICSEEACYAKNRRAVTVLSMGAGS